MKASKEREMHGSNWKEDIVYCLFNPKSGFFYTLTVLENNDGFFRVLKTILDEEGKIIDDGLIERYFDTHFSASRYVEKLAERKKRRKGYGDSYLGYGDSYFMLSDPVRRWINNQTGRISRDQERLGEIDCTKYIVQIDDNSGMEKMFDQGVTYVAERIRGMSDHMYVYDRVGEKRRLSTDRLSDINKVERENLTKETIDA
jgi:hypothetical protein